MSASPADVIFCDVCGESVPTRDLDRGIARRDGNRVLCSHHAAEIRKPPSLRAGWPLGLVLGIPLVSMAALGLSLWALSVSLKKPGRDDVEGAARRAETAISSLENRLSRSEADARAALAAAAEEQVALASRFDAEASRLDALAERAHSLDARLLEFEAAIAAVQASSTETAAALRADFASLRTELGSFRDELASERQARERAEAAFAPPIGEPSRAVAPEIDEQRRQLVAADPAVRFSALVELAKRLGTDAAGDVAIALSDTDPFIRAFATRLLGDFRLPATVPDLVIALRDTDADVRRAALVSMRAIAGSDFGYDPDAAEEGRSTAIRRVEEWFSRGERREK